MNYVDNVPQLQPLPVVIQPAPAIVRGSPLDEADVMSSIRDALVRYNHHEVDPTAVTPGDVVAAIARSNPIINLHSAARYPSEWTITMIETQVILTETQLRMQQTQQQMQQQLQDLTQVQQQMQQQLQDLTQVQQHMQQQLQDLTQVQQHMQQQLQDLTHGQQQNNAQLWNYRAAIHNARCIANDTLHTTPFRCFRKYVPGLGNSLPRVARNLQLNVPVIDVGELVPQAFFPENFRALRTWTHAQISALSMLMNDDFGIVPTDSVDQCRLRLQYYIAN